MAALSSVWPFGWVRIRSKLEPEVQSWSMSSRCVSDAAITATIVTTAMTDQIERERAAAVACGAARWR